MLVDVLGPFQCCNGPGSGPASAANVASSQLDRTEGQKPRDHRHIEPRKVSPFCKLATHPLAPWCSLGYCKSMQHRPLVGPEKFKSKGCCVVEAGNTELRVLMFSPSISKAVQHSHQMTTCRTSPPNALKRPRRVNPMPTMTHSLNLSKRMAFQVTRKWPWFLPRCRSPVTKRLQQGRLAMANPSRLRNPDNTRVPFMPN